MAKEGWYGTLPMSNVEVADDKSHNERTFNNQHKSTYFIAKRVSVENNGKIENTL